MDESFLLRVALGGAIIGIGVLFVLSRMMGVEQISLQEIEGMEPETEVKVTGVVNSVRDMGTVLVFEVAQPQLLDVMLFKRRNMSLRKGDVVEIEGELTEYKGKKELVAASIEKFE